eukprot:1158618-Pelagomonas_calceolata.AAC.4
MTSITTVKMSKGSRAAREFPDRRIELRTGKLSLNFPDRAQWKRGQGRGARPSSRRVNGKGHVNSDEGENSHCNECMDTVADGRHWQMNSAPRTAHTTYESQSIDWGKSRALWQAGQTIDM